MVKWIIAGGFGLAFLASKANQLSLFASNLQYYIKNFLVPSIKSGFIHFPIKVQFENHSSLPFLIDRILTTISYWDGTSWATIGSSIPTNDGYEIPANRIITHTIEPRISITTAVTTLGSSILSNLLFLPTWLANQSWQIHTKAYKAGKMVVEDKQVFGPKANESEVSGINREMLI